VQIILIVAQALDVLCLIGLTAPSKRFDRAVRPCGARQRDTKLNTENESFYDWFYSYDVE
jgi:hypothetical protein